MRSLIIAHPDHDTAGKLHSLLHSRGLPVLGIATSGAQVLQQVAQCDEGCVIISPFRLHDLSANEIRRLLDPTCDMLVLVNARQISQVYGEGIYTLVQPFSGQDVLDAASGLLDHRPPQILLQPTEALSYSQPQVSSPGLDKTTVNRSTDEQQIIERAKSFLMQRKHMTEPEAHRFLQKRSMESGIRIVELAKRLLQ
jgi:response regulator NasT